MNILLSKGTNSYKLLDSGGGYKLEKFGCNIIVRSDTNCIWARSLPEDIWQTADAKYNSSNKSGKKWDVKKTFKEDWIFKYKDLSFLLRLSQSKNIGIFPEQMENWRWMIDIIKKIITQTGAVPNVLNLFAYTGGATLCAAWAGAKVCHVDASKAAISWAKKNQEFSGLQNASIRWIVDDCYSFVCREIKRKVQYDAIIMDPPAFGRDQKGRIFEFERKIYNLLSICKVLVPTPLFFIFNGYSMGYSSVVLKNLLYDFYPSFQIEHGELNILQENSVRLLPCSLFARIKALKDT